VSHGLAAVEIEALPRRIHCLADLEVDSGDWGSAVNV
jgi:hypothetical protein